MKEFEVMELPSGFSVRHEPTGLEVWLGDGVDILLHDDGTALSPSSDGFCEKWEAILNIEADNTREAYFPDIDN